LVKQTLHNLPIRRLLFKGVNMEIK